MIHCLCIGACGIAVNWGHSLPGMTLELLWSTVLKETTRDKYWKTCVGKAFQYRLCNQLRIYVITCETAGRVIQLTSPWQDDSTASIAIPVLLVRKDRNCHVRTYLPMSKTLLLSSTLLLTTHSNYSTSNWGCAASLSISASFIVPPSCPSPASPAGCTGVCFSNTNDEHYIGRWLQCWPICYPHFQTWMQLLRFPPLADCYWAYKINWHYCNLIWPCLRLWPIINCRLHYHSSLLNSDHLCITVDLKYRSPHLSSLPHRVWKYNAADLEGVNDFLSTALPDHIADDVNLLWNTFQSIFLTSMSTYIPSQVVAVRCSFPWLTRELKTLFHKRDSALRQAKKYSKPTHWEVYNRLRNKAAAALRFAKSIYFWNSITIWILKAYHSLSSNRQQIPHLLTHKSVTAESSPDQAT